MTAYGRLLDTVVENLEAPRQLLGLSADKPVAQPLTKLERDLLEMPMSTDWIQ